MAVDKIDLTKTYVSPPVTIDANEHVAKHVSTGLTVESIPLKVEALSDDAGVFSVPLVVRYFGVPPLPFNPTYKRICWHDWVSEGTEEIRGPARRWVGMGGLLLVALSFAWLFYMCGERGFTGIPALVGVISGAVLFLYGADRPYRSLYTRTCSDRVCAKCGRVKLDLTNRRKAAEQAERLEAAVTATLLQAEREAEAARAELVTGAVKHLRACRELARKA